MLIVGRSRTTNWPDHFHPGDCSTVIWKNCTFYTRSSFPPCNSFKHDDDFTFSFFILIFPFPVNFISYYANSLVSSATTSWAAKFHLESGYLLIWKICTFCARSLLGSNPPHLDFLCCGFATDAFTFHNRSSLLGFSVLYTLHTLRVLTTSHPFFVFTFVSSSFTFLPQILQLPQRQPTNRKHTIWN